MSHGGRRGRAKKEKKNHTLESERKIEKRRIDKDSKLSPEDLQYNIEVGQLSFI